MKKETLRFKVVSFRNIETPFHKKGYKNYYCVVDVKDLPDLSNWREINVRDPKLTGTVPKHIADSFHDNPELFLFMNRGITLSVAAASFNNQTSEVEITLNNQDNHGLLDGGHSYTIIKRELLGLPDSETQYVKLELLEGFSLEDITNVVDARNTSNQVKDQSLMELGKKFDSLKKHLERTKFINDIAFSEYETYKDSSIPKPIDIRDIIAILTVFDKDHYNDTVHPIISYSSKAACLKRFRDFSQSYEKLFPLASELLKLHDHIYDLFPKLYGEFRKQSGLSRGSFGKLTGVASKSSDLYFLGRKSEDTVPSGFIFPMLASFRSFLEPINGLYKWGKKVDVFDLVESDLGIRLVSIIGDEALRNRNPNKTGKSSLVWQSCYQAAENYYLKMN